VIEIVAVVRKLTDARIAVILPNFLKNMQYQVNLKQTEAGYAVWCPSLLGCASQGTTKEEAFPKIQLYLKS
jgi:hypothetical protein